MDVAKNNVAGVENNYLKNRHFLCKMSPDEIVGIGIYAAEKRLAYFGILKTDVWAIESVFFSRPGKVMFNLR